MQKCLCTEFKSWVSQTNDGVPLFGHTGSLRVHFEAQLIPSTYTVPMHGASVPEDWRGVDVGQIRAQLRLPVTERVRVMVEAANLLMAVQERARGARNSEVG